MILSGCNIKGLSQSLYFLKIKLMHLTHSVYLYFNDTGFVSYIIYRRNQKYKNKINKLVKIFSYFIFQLSTCHLIHNASFTFFILLYAF